MQLLVEDMRLHGHSLRTVVEELSPVVSPNEMMRNVRQELEWMLPASGWKKALLRDFCGATE